MSYVEDQSFKADARKVLDLIWTTTGGDLSSVPRSYLETLRHEFSEGTISMLELIDRVDLGPDATFEDYVEVAEALMEVDPSYWPDPEDIEEIQADRINAEVDFSEDDFGDLILSFAEGDVAPGEQGQPVGTPMDLSEKMELFLKKVIASVYLDGVSAVTDSEGNPPNPANGYLLSEDGTQFEGLFFDDLPNGKQKKFAFIISEEPNGKWVIDY